MEEQENALNIQSNGCAGCLLILLVSSFASIGIVTVIWYLAELITGVMATV